MAEGEKNELESSGSAQAIDGGSAFFHAISGGRRGKQMAGKGPGKAGRAVGMAL